MTDLSQRWTVPGYTEAKQLGAGGFGTVMLARHDATGTTVAIKYLLPEVGQRPGYAELFRAEAESLGALDTPYVVKLYEYVESGADAAIVMELVNGVTLGDILSEHGATTPEAALVVLFGSLLGLAAAHQRGVVHRDFKPGNVLVNARGASKLTDFGIAARSGRPTVPAGSVPYAPPEQFGGGPASPAGDVYSATATFYECLTGRPPFTGPTTESVIAQHRSAPVPMDPVPEALRPIVARGLAKDPAWRPADAAALASELRTAATGGYGADWERRGRSHLGEAAVLLAALWPSAGGYAVGGFQAEQVHLTQGGQAGQGGHGTQAAQHGQGGQAAHQPASRAGAHRWHLRHVQHEEHLAHLQSGGGKTTTRVATHGAGRLHSVVAVVGAAAVVAAGVTVATTRAPGGSGTAGHPAVAAYQAAPPASIGVNAISTVGPGGLPYAQYIPPNQPQTNLTSIVGNFKSTTVGEVARLYAQQFPFTAPATLVSSTTLTPGPGPSDYDFDVSPTIATRYRIKLFSNATSTAPLATSAATTVYVTANDSLTDNALSGACSPSSPVGRPSCTFTLTIAAYAPAAALEAEMARPNYLYGVPATQAAELTAGTATEQLVPATFTTRRVADDEYEILATYLDDPTTLDITGFCTKSAEAQDGVGFPGTSACGSKSIPESDHYILMTI